MIPRIVYPGERIRASAFFTYNNGSKVISKDDTIYPIWRIIDHQGDFILGGVGTFDEKSQTYLADIVLPDYLEISASHSNPSVDTSNQDQRPYLIDWEIVDIQGNTWNFRETFEVGNPLFTSEVKEQQRLVIPMASLCLSIPLVRNLSFDSSLLFEVYDMNNKVIWSGLPVTNGSYGEYYIYSIEIPPNTFKEGNDYLGLWQFSDCPLGGRLQNRVNPLDNEVSCTTYVDTTSGESTNYPIQNSSKTIFTQVIQCAGMWELKLISGMRMYLDKVAKNLDIYTGYKDSDLYFHLKRGSEILNGFGLLTSWTLNDWKIMQILKGAEYWLLQAACYSALRAQFLAEADSTFDFSSQPVNLSIDRTGFIESELGRLQEQLTQFASMKNQIIKSLKSVGHVNLQYPSVNPTWGIVDRRNLGFPFPVLSAYSVGR